MTKFMQRIANPSVFIQFYIRKLELLTIEQKSIQHSQIHGGKGGSPGGWEVHISYHNGDHYNR